MTDTELMSDALDIRLKPDRPEAGAEMEIQVAAAPADVDGLIVELCDGGGADLAWAKLERDPDGGRMRALLRLAAPRAPGHHTLSVRVLGSDGPVAERALAVEVVAPVVRPSVWNLPPAIPAGQSFRFTVGLASTPGWSAANRGFVVEDADGNSVQSGLTGAEAVAGSEGLFSAEVEVAAPVKSGRHLWRVRPLDPGTDAPRIVSAEVHLNVVQPPDRVIRIRARDAVTGAPVERARVVAHPFRALTDAEGRAEIAVPAGAYRVFVSGHQYFPFRSDADLAAADAVDIVAEMHVDRAFDEADQWA
ncbi:carboxypeptidase-like regulatory domain-containing protein [Roseicyclus sp.]|uniref:carboxypeptidase-like regulatory domain-containing protein n=1 Tax=Roseicyclus sp. TaxID=1914329 RepID=UPI003F9F8824